MNARSLILYVEIRRIHIERNKTNDVFCAGCLQATIQAEKSHCCEKEVITKEEALRRIPVIVEKLQKRL